MSPIIISPLSPLLTDPITVILDASWLHRPHPPSRDAHREFLQRRLPRARFWSLADVSEPDTGIDFMLPSPERFAAFASKAGIRRDSLVVVYDQDGCFAAPRTVWTFKAYGHEKVAFLNGGLRHAEELGVEIKEGGIPSVFEETSYPIPKLQPELLANYNDVVLASNESTTHTLILDARPNSYPLGYIPFSLPLPFSSIATAKPGGYNFLERPETIMAQVVEVVGVGKAEEIFAGRHTVINSCGKGISAAIVWLALQTIGVESSVYDESWTGYILHPGFKQEVYALVV